MSEEDGEGIGAFINSSTTRRGFIGAALLAAVGGLTLSQAREFLDMGAPASGRIWKAANREISDEIDNPYGDASIQIDSDGVPHIQSDDEEAAYFAAGYIQAFDRMAQMDLFRRLLRGELAEVVGNEEEIVEMDEFNKRMDFASAAETTVAGLYGSEVEPLGIAFADGVNACLENEELQLEFQVLGYEPEPWSLVDSLLMEKMISWGLTAAFTELRWAQYEGSLPSEVVDDIYPTFLEHEYPIIREEHQELMDEARIGSEERKRAMTEPVSNELVSWLERFETQPGIGSNNWAVSAEKTGGNSIVACDPHLELMAPPIWYEMHIDAPDYNVRGATFPGVPFIVKGANEHGAWGFTNSGADVLDAYAYEVSDDGEQYLYKGEWRDFETEEKEIVIDGAPNKTITTKKTVHGPYVDRGPLNEYDHTVAIAWTGLTATKTTEAVYEINRSTGVDDALEASRDFDLPTQNFVYADEDETLYVLVGRLPIREDVPDDVLPAVSIWNGSEGQGEWPGFTPYGESTWEGFVPFEEKPVVRGADYIATANQRIMDNPAHYIGVAYASPYRGKRLYDLFDEADESGTVMDREFNEEVQTDFRDERAAQLVPELVDAVNEHRSDDDAAMDAADTLESWSYEMHRDERGALVFDLWMEHFTDEVLNPMFEEAGIEAGMFVRPWPIATLREDSQLFDDMSRSETMAVAMDKALEEIDEEGWETYGDYRTTGGITHQFGDILGFLNYEEYRADGSAHTVKNFSGGSGSSWRMVYESGNTGNAILPGGNSGDWFSKHYEDQLKQWTDGEYKSMSLESSGERTVEFVEVEQ